MNGDQTHEKVSKRTFKRTTLTGLLSIAAVLVWGAAWMQGDDEQSGGTPTVAAPGSYVVFGYNDLGMHCLGQDFSEICILPPANTLHAQVIRRGEDPDIVTSGVTVGYSIPGNTRSDNKTNFWVYAKQLFGVAIPPNVGVFGAKLAGNMAPTGAGDWSVKGIPITPLDDKMNNNPYQLATVTVRSGTGTLLASTKPVVPVSWEMKCNLCHSPNDPTKTNAAILASHDRLHGTNLRNQKPVFCATCHADPALGKPGNPQLHNLSRAMHGAHALRMAQSPLDNKCYSCHPGPVTQCQRDIHSAKGLTCTNCHGDMTAVASATRTPWVTLPKCGTCHQVAGHEYEQPNTLFRDSKGHHGVMCEACHGSPHAITPTRTAPDNVQAIALQGHAGTIDTCTVCHTRKPDDKFDHRFSGDD